MQHNYVHMRLIYVNMQHNYVNIPLIYVNMQHNYIMQKVQKVYKNIYFTTLVRHMCEFDVVVDYWYS